MEIKKMKIPTPVVDLEKINTNNNNLKTTNEMNMGPDTNNSLVKNKMNWIRGFLAAACIFVMLTARNPPINTKHVLVKMKMNGIQ